MTAQASLQALRLQMLGGFDPPRFLALQGRWGKGRFEIPADVVRTCSFFLGWNIPNNNPRKESWSDQVSHFNSASLSTVDQWNVDNRSALV